MRRLVTLVLCLVLLVPLASPRPARAQISVQDYINWIENALQVIQQAYEIYQKYQQLANDYKRYETMVKNLEQFDELSFRNLVGLTVAVNDLIQEGESIGHTLDNVDEVFVDTFPGYQGILGEDWRETYQRRATRALDTMRYAMQALHRVSWSSVPSQDQLNDLAIDVRLADGALEAQQAGNELLHHQSVEIAKLNQQISVQTNVETIYWAYRINKDAEELATSRDWIANGVAPVPEYDGEGGVRGIPANWLYCYGCD